MKKSLLLDLAWILLVENLEGLKKVEILLTSKFTFDFLCLLFHENLVLEELGEFFVDLRSIELSKAFLAVVLVDHRFIIHRIKLTSFLRLYSQWVVRLFAFLANHLILGIVSIIILRLEIMTLFFNGTLEWGWSLCWFLLVVNLFFWKPLVHVSLLLTLKGPLI